MSETRIRLILIVIVGLAYPFSWFAPLAHAGLLPLFGMSEISIVTGLISLFESDIFLAILVMFFALIAPIAKVFGLILSELRTVPLWLSKTVSVLGRFAMADIFLIALYITISKGIGIGRIETDWGLYLFSACVIASLLLGMWQKRTT